MYFFFIEGNKTYITLKATSSIILKHENESYIAFLVVVHFAVLTISCVFYWNRVESTNSKITFWCSTEWGLSVASTLFLSHCDEINDKWTKRRTSVYFIVGFIPGPSGNCPKKIFCATIKCTWKQACTLKINSWFFS